LSRRAALSLRHRELVIDRTTARCGAEYEWGIHIAVYAAKVVVFRSFGALPLDVIVKGAITGSTLMAGAFIARRFVLTMPAERFRHLMDGVLLLSGVALLALALRG
jgi:uncharacterized membrane protein YfcA